MPDENIEVLPDATTEHTPSATPETIEEVEETVEQIGEQLLARMDSINARLDTLEAAINGDFEDGDGTEGEGGGTPEPDTPSETIVTTPGDERPRRDHIWFRKVNE